MNKKFGLFTSVCMIIGIVIGSGIFFKSDNVLTATGGSVLLGVLVFCIAASAIIFGSLTIAELAMRTEKTGGIIAYAEEHLGSIAACVFGWMQNFVYYPTITVVVSWVVGIYGCILFGIKGTLEHQILIGFSVYTVLFIMNYLSTRMAGVFQNLSTILKLLPLALVAVAGIFFGSPDFSAVSAATLTTGSAAAGGLGWLSAIGPIAFSYDGWTVAPSLSHEIRDAKRNLPRALVIAPLFILFAYVVYFIGITRLADPATIMAMGDSHVDLVFEHLLGATGSKISLIFVIISIMGTSNGLILGGSRGLYALGTKQLVPGAGHLAMLNQKHGTPVYSLLASYLVCTFWMGVHYITTKLNLLPNSDISEISIVTMYLLYMVLYVQVIKMKRRGEIGSVVRGYVNPVLAIIGSLIIFCGGIQNAMFFAYLGFSLLVLLAARIYARRHRHQKELILQTKG